MNPALLAAINKANKHSSQAESVVAQLKRKKAISASSAVDLPDADPAKVDEAIGQGLVLRSVDGRLHLNEIAVANHQESQGMMALLILLVLASVAGSAFALLNFATR